MTSDLSQTSVDITKLRQTEQALRESEEHLRQIFNSISDHIYVTELTQDGQHLNRYISPTEPLTGYPTELIKADWNFWPSQLVHPEDRDFAATQSARFAQGLDSEVEYRLIRADGRIIWVRDSTRVDRDPDNGHLLIYGVVSDITDRKRAEEALRESEEKYRKVIGAANDAVIIADMDTGFITDANKRAEELVGIPLAELIGMHQTQLHPPEQAAFYRQAFESSRQTTGRKLHEMEVQHRDGRRIPVEISDSLIEGKGGKKLVLGIFRDVTTRKKAQAALEATNLALQRSNQRLGAMYEITQMINSQLELNTLLNSIARSAARLLNADTGAIFLLDEASRLLTIRGAYGLSEEMIGQAGDCVKDSIAGQVTLTGKPLITDNLPEAPYFNNALVGDEGLLACASVPLKAGAKIIGALNVYSRSEHCTFDAEQVKLLDMLAGQAAVAIENARLYEEEQRQRKIAESLREVATAINGSLDLNIVLDKIFEQLERVVNFDGASIFLQEEDYLEVQAGRNIPSHYLGARLPLDGQNVSLKPFRDQKVHIVPDVHQDPHWEYWPEGERIRSWMGAPLLHNQQAIGLLTVDNFTPNAYCEEDGRVLQIFANQATVAIKNARLYATAQHEIIEHERTEEALMSARDQAIKANQLKTQLLAKVSHELRTPLGAILGYTELMQNGVFGPLSERQLKITQEIIDSTHYLTQTVGELLDQAKLETGEILFDARSFNPTELVKRVETKMNVLAQAKGLRLITTMAATMPSFLLGDPQRLQQILFNLVSNAIKFTKTGEVRVHLYCPDPDHWAIEVSDTGLGIPPDAQTYIFEPFRQIDASMTREQNGTGLGLSIVKQLVDLMNGEIKLESQVHQGSTFTIVLPLVPRYVHERNRA